MRLTYEYYERSGFRGFASTEKVKSIAVSVSGALNKDRGTACACERVLNEGI